MTTSGNGFGADGRYDLARITHEIEAADIIALQEVDRFWKRSGMVDSLALLAEYLPERAYVFGANLDLDADFGDDGKRDHRRKQFGTMVMSRWPILSTRNFPLPKWGDGTHRSIRQLLLEAIIDTPTGPLRVYSLHLNYLAPFTRPPPIALKKEILRAAPEEGGAWCGGHPDPFAVWLEEPEPTMPDSLVLMGDIVFPRLRGIRPDGRWGVEGIWVADQPQRAGRCLGRGRPRRCGRVDPSQRQGPD